MAKTSWLQRNKKKIETAKKYSSIRTEFKRTGQFDALNKLPRNASPVRIVNRCSFSGRRRGFIRKYGVSRLTFREAALSGLIPGVIKASW